MAQFLNNTKKSLFDGSSTINPKINPEFTISKPQKSIPFSMKKVEEGSTSARESARSSQELEMAKKRSSRFIPSIMISSVRSRLKKMRLSGKKFSRTKKTSSGNKKTFEEMVNNCEELFKSSANKTVNLDELRIKPEIRKVDVFKSFSYAKIIMGEPESNSLELQNKRMVNTISV